VGGTKAKQEEKGGIKGRLTVIKIREEKTVKFKYMGWVKGV